MMIVEIINIFGKSYKLPINDDEIWTVEMLKKAYGNAFGAPPSNWYFMHNGKFLKNSELLSTYGISHGSIVHVTSREAVRMTNPVELLIYHSNNEFEVQHNNGGLEEELLVEMNGLNSGKMSLIYAERDWTVLRVKTELARARDISDWNNFKLYHKGKLLNEKRLLSEYNITNEAVLHCTMMAHNSVIKKPFFGLKRYLLSRYLLKVS